MTGFADLGLSRPLLAALDAKGYDTPTPIQMKAIPPVLAGRDLCGIAQTGTGKTAAFALPSLHRLYASRKPLKPLHCRMLVLSPTRELAAQIAASFRGYSKAGPKIRIEAVFGGVPIGRQIRAMSQGVDVLVATPGRLLDLIDQRAVSLRDVEIFVLDEADQMLDLGFIDALKKIATLLPGERQTLFFSATMPKSIADLGQRFLNDAVQISVTPPATTAERVRHQLIFVERADKQALLTITLIRTQVERGLVFTRTKRGADKVVKHLKAAGIQCAAIHGDKSQPQRTAAIQGFHTGAIPILIATDIAARGIDVPGVSHVFNYELPEVPEQYVHRIGRTARAGAEGIAISFVDAEERGWLRRIERVTRAVFEEMSLPEDFEKARKNLPRPAVDKPRPDTRRREQREREEGPVKPSRPRRRRPVGAHKGAVRKTRRN